MDSELSILASSVAEPYNFHTDPDPGCEKNSLRIRIQAKTKWIRIQQKRTKYQENLRKVI